MDVKKLGKIPDGGDGRGRGEPLSNHHSPIDKKPIGYDSLINDHSRLAYSEIHSDEKAPTYAAFLARALDYVEAHGSQQTATNLMDACT